MKLQISQRKKLISKINNLVIQAKYYMIYDMYSINIISFALKFLI